METVGLVLMTVAILQYGVIPIVADFNSSHATNPRWPAHARFHVVAQVLTTSSVAVVALWLLWSPQIERSLGICLAATLSGCVLGGFHIGALCRHWYGGALSDADGGIPKARGVYLNVVNFGLATVLLVAGRLALR